MSGPEFTFAGEIFQWRGPAPFYYVAVPEDESEDIRAISAALTYGWGCIPVEVRVGGTAFETSLFPKDGRYLVPVKAKVRTALGLVPGDTVTIRLNVGDQ